MQFLFVRVVKAQCFPSKDITGSLDPYVEVRVGNYKGDTTLRKKSKVQNGIQYYLLLLKKECSLLFWMLWSRIRIY
ncbi:hypothetical protein MTR67_036335 [Solanum verrucosum]|uniref:C2 domain-containing protein n=1 Tax=Solanum verrucosum TaxID=315347 RepID=A0AAF0ZMH7_SOLVR|nr:hypothetical protein MTR67_036335 [Solanum verrucosum]